jgi:hypothetical protein
MAVFCDVTPCSLVQRHQGFEESAAFILTLALYSSSMTMQTQNSSGILLPSTKLHGVTYQCTVILMLPQEPQLLNTLWISVIWMEDLGKQDLGWR